MLLQKIKDARMVARKAHDTAASSLLTTLVGEAEMIGKSAGNRESTDAEVLQVLRKFEKNMLENFNIFETRGMFEDLEVVEFELKLVRQFLPVKLTNLQVEKDIGTIMQAQGLAREQKSMGVVVKELKAKYGDQFDGQQTSTIFKRMMA